MTVPHLTLFHCKIVTAALATAGALIVAMDPTVKVALIVAVPTTITGLGTLILGFLSRSDLKKSLLNQDDLKHSMDGNFNRLWTEKNVQAGELADKSDKLAHAEGHREGSEEERSKQ